MTPSESRTPTLILSLDLELYWGVHHANDFSQRRRGLADTRRAIDGILERLSGEGMAATWAAVGLLGCKDEQEARELFPRPLPAYRDPLSNAYRLLDAELTDEMRSALFAPEIISRILRTPRQELATHTFSHLLCAEPGVTDDDFRRDLEVAVVQARGWGADIRSIVFPRNFYTSQQLQTCRDLGLRTFRGNPPSRIHEGRPLEREAPWIRALRMIDSHLPLMPSSAAPLQREAGLWNVRASRFLRVAPTDELSSTLRLRRILKEMRETCESGGVFHLWWHPHNFGSNPDAGFRMLDAIVRQFRILSSQYGMRSMTMASAAEAAEQDESRHVAA